jgi:glycosyltransferase involved in cell wall biosynthesis
MLGPWGIHSMRVLFVLRTLTAGGIEPHLMTLGKGLAAKGCEVALASDGGIGNHTHGSDWFEAAGLRHYQVRFPGPGSLSDRIRRVPAGLRELHATVKDFHPDVIHIHYRATSVYAEAMRYMHSVPFVSTLHMTGIPSGMLHRLTSFWGRRAIAISREVWEYLNSAFGVDQSRIRLVYNGADESFFRPPSPDEKQRARQALNIPQGTAVIAMAARMSREKGHDVLLDAMSRMRTQNRDALALLAGVSIEGDTTWRDEVLRRAERMGLADCIRLLGYTDTRQLLWASDVSVLPSRREGFPMAVVESMLCGVVPIRTPAAGAKEQITDGQDGFIIPFDDSESLAQRLTLVLDDPGLRGRIGEAAIAKARKSFSAAAMVQKTMEVYREALSASY